MSVAATVDASLYLDSDRLLEAVEAVGVVCENGKQASHDSCIFLDYADDTLTVAARNVRKRVWAEVRIPLPSWSFRRGEREEFRHIAVHRADLVKALRGKGAKTLIKIKSENTLLITTYNKISKLDIKPQAKGEIPAPGTEAAMWERTDLVPTLRTALRFVAPESSDAYQGALTGILFDDEYIVGCDATQLVRYKAVDVGRQFIIPSLAAAVICKLFSPLEQIKMIVDKHTAVFETPDSKVTCQFIEARYPDWRRVFPSTPLGVCRVSARGLLAKIAALASSEENFDPYTVTEWLTLIGSDNQQDLKINYHAGAHRRTPLWTTTQQARVRGNFNIAVRTHYLKNILECFNRPVIKYHGRTSPLEFVEEDTACLVMPVAW